LRTAKLMIFLLSSHENFFWMKWILNKSQLHFKTELLLWNDYRLPLVEFWLNTYNLIWLTDKTSFPHNSLSYLTVLQYNKILFVRYYKPHLLKNCIRLSWIPRFFFLIFLVLRVMSSLVGVVFNPCHGW